MAYDGMVTHSVVSELNMLLSGGKIDKVYQPEKEEIIFSVRTPQGSHRLLMSASSSNARVHLTTSTRENPKVPPMFCMLMRKHLQGNKVLGFSQLGYDRVIRMDTEGRNEMGDVCIHSVVVEIMGRHSNVILLDEQNKIMDSVKHVDFTVSAVRQILSGLFYENPPRQDKVSPEQYSLPDLLTALDNQPEDALLDTFLLSSIEGMSPLFAREIVYRFSKNTKVTRGEVDTAAFITHADAMLQDVVKGAFAPTLLLSPQDKTPFAFSCIDLKQYENQGIIKNSASISEIIDAFYELRSKNERLTQRGAHLTKLLVNNIERCRKKLMLHQDNLEKSQNREKYKIYGDLITANIYQLKQGGKEAHLLNYFDENMETVTVPLDENLTPAQNAQRYYKRYQKAKTTEQYAKEQAMEAKIELSYLESVLAALEKSDTLADLAEIREELAEQGYIPHHPGKQKKNAQKSAPRRFVSSDGFDILVGRNNKQNDELTIRMAYSTDLWFHTKEIPGSHTLIRTQGGKDVPDKTILEAAQIAAYFSKAQNSSKVPVDYTVIKNVKKPNGAKPGMVIYDHYNTLYVEPKLPFEEK